MAQEAIHIPPGGLLLCLLLIDALIEEFVILALLKTRTHQRNAVEKHHFALIHVGFLQHSIHALHIFGGIALESEFCPPFRCLNTIEE